MKLKYCTITGADDSIFPQKLTELSQVYTYAEWGILLSRSQVGNNRFPSMSWMRKLSKIPNLNLSGHLCGKWVIDLVQEGRILFIDDIPLWEKFSRIQLNFHGIPHTLTPEGLEALRTLCWKQKKRFIVQMDGVNNEIFPKLMNAGVAAFPLFDVSHGAGILPTEWPKTLIPESDPDIVPSINPHIIRGYAGGLSPLNIAEQLKKLDEIVEDDIIWIDMETKVRSADDLKFDLDKVKICLEAAKQYV